MRAIEYFRYGSPEILKFTEQAPKPVPAPDEVLVKVHASSINAADWHLLTADIFLVRLQMGLLAPRRNILGLDVAGTVEGVGSSVTRFKRGEAVFGVLLNFKVGAFAEYVCVPERFLERKPENLGFEAAAATPLASITALQALRDLGEVKPGQQVLIQGASGGVGSFAVQVAKLLGAEVTAVCSPSKQALAKQLGADQVLDYTRQDFTKLGQRYDVVLGINGHRSLSDDQRVLKPRGRYVMIGGTQKQMFEALFLGGFKSSKTGQRFQTLTLKFNPLDLPFLRSHLTQGTLVPVIDQSIPLAELPEAMKQFGQGRSKGKTVVTVQP